MRTELYALEAVGLCRRFGGVQALDGASLTLERGRITALLGSSGAGKSTLLACLSGAERPESGSIQIDGRPLTLGSPRLAQKAGVRLVPQSPALAGGLDVASHIFLGREPLKWGLWVDRKKMTQDAQNLLDRWEVPLPARGVRVGDLSRGQQQTILLLQALAAGARVLLLDEPAAFIGLRDRERFFKMLGEFRSSGAALLCAFHRLSDALRFSDNLAVLARGKIVLTCQTAQADGAEILSAMG